MHVDEQVQTRPYTHARYWEWQEINRFGPHAVDTDKLFTCETR